ncbi:DUF4157 domain-containing protein [Streptomyces violascens]|uniref:DUF4157 domain-containing protein n=1 Tax=Streptomyces violascens TaxID=67381 RepID=UPI0037AA51DF
MHANEQSQTPERDGPGRSSVKPARTGMPAGLLALQASAGNAAVVQMLRRAGHPGIQEQHQHGAGCGHQQAERPAVQRSAVHDVLRTSGRPMDAATRTDMESRLGADFSDVRIHNDAAAKASAAEVGARAYTSGSHVVIGDGGADKHTLAHELTHVIQQRQGPVAGNDNGSGLKVSDPSDRFEREAEANATRVMRSALTSEGTARTGAAELTAPTHTPGNSTIQRYEDGDIGDDSWRVSKTGKYMISGAMGDDAFEIHVRAGAETPRYCEPSGEPISLLGEQYVPHRPTSLFLRDCLHTAEEIMQQQTLNGGQVTSQVKGLGGVAFGDGEEENIAAAHAYAERRGARNDHSEQPVAGQAYVIVETEYTEDGDPAGESGFPFHAAAVVAVDGTDRITLEQLAGSSDAEQGAGAHGIFDIYESGARVGKRLIEKTFHGRHVTNFTQGAITITIEPMEGTFAPDLVERSEPMEMD